MRVDEETKVVLWQFDRFVDLGFSRDDASELVNAGCDYHDVERLVRAGCPLDLALQIVL